KDKGVLQAFVKLAEQSDAPKDVLMMLLLTTRVEQDAPGKEEGEIDEEEAERRRQQKQEEEEREARAKAEAEEVRQKAEEARKREEEARKQARKEAGLDSEDEDAP